MATHKLISALTPLRPTQITDAKTGEVILASEHDKQVISLVEFVTQSVSSYYNTNSALLEAALNVNLLKFAPAEWARANGFNLDMNQLPQGVKVKSRVERLYRHKLVSETSSYVNNPNPRKQAPTFSPKINLGAADSHMASLSREGNTLTLRFKVWEKDYLIDFELPDYILKRNIKKWSLPTIELRKGVPYYIFTIEEIPETRRFSKNKAGIDLGRVEPFVLAVTNEKGRRIAHYTASGRLKQLNAKRERILKEKKHVLRKADTYKALGLDDTVLRAEARRKSGKALILGDVIASQVGAEVARRLRKHELNTLAVEDLRWATGSKYGSKWAHSKTQAKIEHVVQRIGVRTKKVNPKNTSQECHVCGARVIHDSRKRVARCSACKEQFDRDFNAAMNIAKRLKSYPARERRHGDKCSSEEQLIENKSSHNSDLRSQIVRMTT